jgi:hypothetical protein
MSFVFLVPGSLLAALRHFQPMLLPRLIVEFLFPLAFFPVEKQLVVEVYNKSASAGQARLDPEIFDRLDIFGQQTFVVALLCFFLILVIYNLKARAGVLLAEPKLELMPVLVVVVTASAVAREFFAYLLVVHVDSITSNLPTRITMFHLLNAFAPEGLIIFSCLIAISLAQMVRFIYLLLAERLG